MVMRIARRKQRHNLPTTLLGSLFLLLGAVPFLRADEPYARSKDYDLQHSKVVMRFDVGQKKVIGDVTHTVAVLVPGTEEVSFDSVGLQIQSVTVNRATARFETTDTKLKVFLPKSAKPGEKLDIEIKYEARPTKGLYFILPDKDYPERPVQIWTQGESEDTRYYLPTYDYPNDRLTTETILTVPAQWKTISNGKLVSVKDVGDGLKVWTWRESLPSSTYLFTIVAGELVEVKDTWRSVPVTYYAPKDRGDRLEPNYSRTPAMIDLFSKKLGVDYPWEKYSQAMVDEFVAGGMENSSATTNTSSSLNHPKLAAELPTGEDGLISHELGHQWFGDLVTTKDWGNIWLNEGFATFMETIWTEAHYGKEEADFDRWRSARAWFGQANLFPKPIVRYDFDDSSEFDGNAYTKGGWVLHMLRHQLGEDQFYAGLKHYLDVNHGRNVTTSDLTEAIEGATHQNVDQFFSQWVYGAGAPKFDLSYTYDDAQKQVLLTVKQTQKLEGRVGLFRIPVDVEITNGNGPRLYPIVVSKASETFTFPSLGAPLMVLFDKGGHVLKSANFKKEKKELLYQLKNATELFDRADAAVALGKLKNDDEVIIALGDALQHDKAWGVRATAAGSLGDLGTSVAARELLSALPRATEPWVRVRVVQAIGKIKDNPEITAKVEEIANTDSSYRARSAALQALGRLKTPTAYTILTGAVNSDSPDSCLRNAALRSFGALGDDKAVPLLRRWAEPGKDLESREAAISSLARLDKGSTEITNEIAGYLKEAHFGIRLAAISALGSRGDASALPALEALLKNGDLSITVGPMIREQIAHLKNLPLKGTAHAGTDEDGEAGVEAAEKSADDRRLGQVEQLLQEMNERLKAIENRLPVRQG